MNELRFLHPSFFIGLSTLYKFISHLIIARLDVEESYGSLNLNNVPEEVRAVLSPIIRILETSDNDDLKRLRESYCRSDLDVKSKMSWSKVMEQLYSDYGYKVGSDIVEPDHIAVEFEFASILFREAGEALSRRDYHTFTQRLIEAHRFISAHLVPALTQCTVPLAKELKDIVILTIETVRPLVIKLIAEDFKHRTRDGSNPTNNPYKTF